MRRAWEGLVGPLPARASAAVLVMSGAGGAAVGGGTARRAGPVRGVVMGAVALDLVGGLVSFQLDPTRHHHAGATRRSRALFVAGHLHPFVLPLAGLGTWRRAALRYAAAVVATTALDALAPRAGRRGLASAVALGCAALDLATAAPGQRWLGPVHLLKLVGGYGAIAPADPRPRQPSTMRGEPPSRLGRRAVNRGVARLGAGSGGLRRRR